MVTCGRCGKEILSTPDCGMCESYRRSARAMRATQRAIDEGRFFKRPPVHPFEEDGAQRGIGFADVAHASEDPGYPDYLEYGEPGDAEIG